MPSKLRSFTSIPSPTKQAHAFLFIHRHLNRDIFLSLFIPFEFGIAGPKWLKSLPGKGSTFIQQALVKRTVREP
jgi:hypothetical protein